MPERKPFQYKTLLRIRKRQEDLRAQALAEARRNVNAAIRRRDEIALEQTRALEQAGTRTASRFNASDVRRYFQYERHLAQLGDETEALIAKLTAVEEERREELDAAMKKRRILERLKERQERAYATELNKEAQAMTDEVATNYAAIAGRENRRAAVEGAMPRLGEAL